MQRSKIESTVESIGEGLAHRLELQFSEPVAVRVVGQAPGLYDMQDVLDLR